MTEQDYIDISNLARVRAALAVLRECTTMTVHEQMELVNVTGPLCEIQDRLVKKVKKMRGGAEWPADGVKEDGAAKRKRSTISTGRRRAPGS